MRKFELGDSARLEISDLCNNVNNGENVFCWVTDAVEFGDTARHIGWDHDTVL